MGSSPLTRGKRQLPKRRGVVPGLIPTHAGKTNTAPANAATAGAHPHSRGENMPGTQESATLEGSSPLTRGKLFPAIASRAEDGLIPTHAGKTGGSITLSNSTRAHPHSRGENHGVQSRIVNQTGSSPLTRGKPYKTAYTPKALRLIPTHAGKTCAPSPASGLTAAHPHSRGENSWLPSLTRTTLGSSPLTRGKPRRGVARHQPDGLIPTHAGKTVSALDTHRQAEAHPHSRGENTRKRQYLACCQGSSPLTRGKRP